MSETSVASYWLIRVDGQFVVSAGASRRRPCSRVGRLARSAIRMRRCL